MSLDLQTHPSRLAVDLPSDASDVEGARAMLQERIELWTLWVALLSGGFYIINVLTFPLNNLPMSLGEMLMHAPTVLHLTGTMIFAAGWLVARRIPLSLRQLRALDAGILMSGCIIFSAMGAAVGLMQTAFRQPPQYGGFAALLACANVVAARAIAVPSTAERTLWLSAAAMSPVPFVSWWTMRQVPDVVSLATWCAVSVAIATVGSRVIFGLRREAARVRRLGQYTLESKLGAGGMGVVYRARHAMLRRPTALKLLPPDRAGEANLIRFEREVQLTAELSHPNTIAIYDYGRTPDGIFYYAMEYLDGINLEQLVARDGPLPAGRVVHILRQVCGALGEAHAKGLLHRDIKPPNIILTERGGEPDVAKVVDFGLVKPLLPTGPGLTVSSSIVLAGTPLYMAPETLTAPGTYDPRSDLYAVGAVGYFLVTGKPLFEAATIAEAFGHHLHSEPIPPSERRGRAVPADLESLLLRCLRKRMEERPTSAGELARALDQCALTSPWTRQQAEEWWRAFRETGGAPAPDPTLAETVTVDLEARARPLI